nr:IstB-like ATP-binding domain-containing protein [Paenibacillus sp. PL91]
MRLQGLADAYLRQIQDPRMNELSFEERFGLLVSVDSESYKFLYGQKDR